MSEDESSQSTATDGGFVTAILIVWTILLVIGAPFGLITTGMAGEGGYTASVYLSLAALWSYPLLLILAFLLRKKARWLSLLPGLPVILIILAIRYNW